MGMGFAVAARRIPQGPAVIAGTIANVFLMRCCLRPLFLSGTAQQPEE
jgi:hypothetical protein